jgi:hypothetical protein
MRRKNNSTLNLRRCPAAYRRAFEWLEEALEREPELSVAERCRLIFGPAPTGPKTPPAVSAANDQAESR